jgi:ABC-2 type transport system permease protein
MTDSSPLRSFAGATWALFHREVIRFLRQRSRLVGALLTPLLFWFLVGGGLGNSFRNPVGNAEGGYFEFFFPGAVALSVLFTAIFSTMSVIEDRNQGFLQGVLVTRVSRGAFVLAKILGGAFLGALQGVLLLLVARVLVLETAWASLAAAVGLLFVMGGALTALGFVFAWKLDSVQGYHGIMNLVLVPLWILSGAVFPSETGNPLFRWIARVNPLSYSVNALRELLSLSSATQLLPALAITLGAGLLLYMLSLRLVSRGG